MAVSTCPSCEAKVELGAHPRLGQRVICGFCNTELEVAWLDPVELDWPFDEEDDVDYDDESSYDYYDEPYEEVEDW